jgi:hypothetical protein
MDTLLLLELTDNLNEALNQLGDAQASDDALSILDAIDAVNDALLALDGEAVVIEQPKDYTPLLNGIINGDTNVFTDQDKISELEQIDEDYANKELAVIAIVEAARQVIIGNGRELA